MRSVLRFLVLTLLLLAAEPSAAQSPAPLQHGITVSPSPLWSSTAGFGIGIGYEVKEFLGPGSEIVVLARPAQHVGRYSATFFTATPYGSRLYGVANAFYETTGRRWFYGLGPASDPDARVAVEKEMLQLEVRMGARLLRDGLSVQPLLRYVRHQVAGYDEWDDGALQRLSGRSFQNLAYVAGSETDVQSGIWYGATLSYDTRDAVNRPRNGVLLQATAQRFDAVDDLDISFDRFGADAYAFFPLGSIRQSLGLRLVTRFTNNRGDVIPFYLLPYLGSDLAPGIPTYRFHGSDLLALSATYRRLLFGVMDVVGVEATLAASAAGVYEDVFDEFEPALTLEDDLAQGEKYPLRPAFGIGGRIVSLTEDRLFFEGMIGYSPEGLGAVTLRFVNDLRTNTRD